MYLVIFRDVIIFATSFKSQKVEYAEIIYRIIFFKETFKIAKMTDAN